METTTLQEFNADLARRRQLAVALGQAPESKYLYLVAKGFKQVSPDMAKRIDAATAQLGLRVPKETLRPDVWEVDLDNNNAGRQRRDNKKG
ncbi:hypothetical protein LF41_2391 [Lysobacter dokdonensis DS-58]|uniref:Uncharacterized protein n=1 Tax=Lysobacter dokdonensis DS-58 TaxID=1300345 RepID=A0A0A2X3P5_9GAMM|nr:hypothetical protein [Lysobacter dokdonensis]KGQ19884.1 hypothetical protein LF41_2391 [Lysobacter dokdonensis DS-58]